MITADELGLAVVRLEPEEYRAGDWRAVAAEAAGADLVRVLRPAREDWPALRAEGFIRKPSTITWTGPVDASEAEYLGRLRQDVRWQIKRARTAAADAGIRIYVEDGVGEQSYDRFLGIYRDVIAGFRHGYPAAVKRRAMMLSGERELFGVYASLGPELIGGCICVEVPEEKEMRIAFGVAGPLGKSLNLMRVLYLTAMNVARDKGHRTMTLGNDPNLYGHIPQPGLIRFKASLGFTPRPSQLCGDTGGYDEAELVLTLRELSDPSVMIGYAEGASAEPLWGYVISDDPRSADVSSLAGVRSLGGVEVVRAGG